MLTKVKTFFAAAVILTVAAAVAINFRGGVIRKPKGDDEPRTAYVSAIWLPSPRDNGGVQIQVWVGATKKVDTTEKVAPFRTSFTVFKGDKVEIRARLLGAPPADVLGCAASIDDGRITTDFKKPAQRGNQVTCWERA